MNKIEKFVFRKVELWVVLFLLCAAMGAGLFWGANIIHNKTFPYSTLKSVRNFLAGHPADTRSLYQRILSELVFNPVEFAATNHEPLLANNSLSAVENRANDKLDWGMSSASMRFYSNLEEKKYFVVFGSFVFPQSKINLGAVLIDSDGVIHRTWPIRPSEYHYQGSGIGLVVTSEGDILTNTNGILTSYNWCGTKNWEAPWEPSSDGIRKDQDAVDGYNWHHDIVVRNNLAYTFKGVSVQAVNVQNGEIESELSALDLIHWARKDNLYIFDVRKKHRFDIDKLNMESMVDLFYHDPFHFNKVDVLTEENATYFEEFEKGDLLLSLRRINLLVVVRPSEEKIIWYRYGMTDGQHDATFGPGYIDVFDNNYSSVPAKPRIVRFEVDKNQRRTLFDLSAWGLEMRIKGNFELIDDQLLVNDYDAGRIIYGNLSGDIHFVLENGFDSEQYGHVVNLALSNATEISHDSVDRFERRCEK